MTSFCKLIMMTGVVSVAAGLLASCTETPTDILPTKDRVWNYYCENRDASPEFKDGFSAYFDFSDGMSEAYKDPATRANLQGISQKITGTDWTIYGMASNRLDTLRLSQTELYNKITQPRYQDIMAPIEKALESIVTNRKRALLVTDFEEYTADKKIQYQNYAKRYFIDWLKKGGMVNFYITDYKEKGQDKHLYFAVFDDYEGTMTKIIDDALAGRVVNYKRFCLNNRPVKVYKSYTNPKKGGNYHDSTGQDIVTAVNEEDPVNDMYCNYDNGLVEFYPCGGAWADIFENAKAVAQLPGTDRFYSLFRGIIMDAGDKDSYRIEDYAIRVTNVQKDYELFSNWQAALRNTPTVTRNPDGTVIVDNAEHPDAQFYYSPETGELLDEYKYNRQSCPEVQNLFVLDSDIMAESRKENPDRTEIAIDFSPNFSAATLSVLPEDLLRVDVLVAKAAPELGRLDELFSWGPANRRNNNLSEAIRNTLQDQEVTPQGQTLFTYFIKAY